MSHRNFVYIVEINVQRLEAGLMIFFIFYNAVPLLLRAGVLYGSVSVTLKLSTVKYLF